MSRDRRTNRTSNFGRPADLIALTIGRRGALSRFLLGNTVECVIRSAGVPVLVSRPRDD